jgi:hypothetical protein
MQSRLNKELQKHVVGKDKVKVVKPEAKFAAR